jgi:hypothetical protein
MPNKDGTGPMGNGTPGKGMGNCGKSRWPGSAVKGNNNRSRSLLDSGADLLVYLIKNLITKKTNNKRS